MSSRPGLLGGVVHDVRIAVRLGLRTPVVTGLAVTALALGIGANTAVFSVMHAVLVPDLPYQDADRLVQVSTRTPTSRSAYARGVTGDTYFAYRDQAVGLDGLVAVKWEGYVLEGTSRFTDVLAVGNGFFSMFGVEPMLGRTLSPSPDVQSAPAGVNPEMMLTHQLWQSHFGGDSTVIGRVVTLDHWDSSDDAFNRRTIVGVLPPSYEAPRYRAGERLVTGAGGALVPLSEGRWSRSQRNFFPFAVFGLLGEDTSLADAETRLQGVLDRVGSDYPEEAGLSVELTRLSALPRTLYGRSLALLWGVVGSILLIACLNVACLMLARSAARDGEFAVRSSLGGSRGRLSRQLLTESLVLAMLGGSVGLVLATVATPVVLALFPGGVVGLDGVSLNGTVLVLTLTASVGTVVLFGWAPLLVASQVRLVERLKGGFGRTSMRSARVLQALIAVESALALVLFGCAGLLINSFIRLTQVEPGFAVDNVLAVTTERAPEFISQYGSQQGQIPVTLLLDQLRDAALSVPGIAEAAVLAGPTGLPFSRRTLNNVTVADRRRPGVEDGLRAVWTNVDPFYHSVMRIPVLMGRGFAPEDEEAGAPVAIVSQSAARQFWPRGDPLGKVITYGHQDLEGGVVDTRVPPPRLYTVIGVVGDVATADIEEGSTPIVYTPLAQSYYAGETATVVMRAAADLRGVSNQASAAILAVDPGEVELIRITSMSGAFNTAIAEPRFYTLLLSLLAGTALVLVLAGVYGVVAYAAKRRTYELGIRVAVGAQPGQVLRLVLRQGMVPVTLGLAAGVTGSVFVGELLSDYLFDVEPGDPLTIGVACLLVAGMATAASYIPAQRATHDSAADLLRAE